MSATIQQIVNYAASNAPAEWAQIINAATFVETLTADTIRVFDSKPVKSRTSRADMFAHGEIDNQVYASNLGSKVAEAGPINNDRLVVTSKRIDIVKNSRKMVVWITWYPLTGYGAKIAVYNR